VEVRRGVAVRAVALVGAGGLVAWAAYLAHWRASHWALPVWLVGVAVGAWALAGRGWRGWRVGWGEVGGVALLVAAALALRLTGLADFPYPMSGDEGSMAMEARRILEGAWVNPFGTGWFSHPNLFFYLHAASLRALGWNLFALRFPSALLGALGVGAVYLLARGVFGRETAWASGIFLAGWSLPLHLSRLALNNAADPLFSALTLALLHRGLVRGRRCSFVAAGLFMGAGLYFYFGLRLLVVLVPLMVALAGWPRAARRWRGLLAMAAVALLVAGPLLLHFARHPDVFVARMARDGLFQSGELQAEQDATGMGLPALLLQHLGCAVGAFVYTLDRGYFYTAPLPMLPAFSGALFVLGVELALLRFRQPRYLGLLLWTGIVVLAVGWLVRSPPGYHRYLVAAPAVCLLVGRALVAMVRRLASALDLHPVLRRGLVLLLAAGLAAGGAYYYFAVYAPSGVFADRNTEIADRTARLMADLGPDYVTFFFGTERMRLGGFNSARFLAPDAEWEDVEDDLPDESKWMRAERGALFIFLPERVSERGLVERRFPGGTEGVAVGRHGDVLFYTYLLPPRGSYPPGAEVPQ